MLFLPAAASGAWMRCTASSAALRRASAATRAAILPDYRSVCSGATGHQEALKLSFDPQVIDLDTVLDIFFTSHDPTSWDRQGADTGSQYRSVLFYADEQQREAFERAVARAQQLYSSPIVTEIKPLGVFYEAEEYHQNYYALNPAQGYCAFVVSPKVAHARRNFAHLLR